MSDKIVKRKCNRTGLRTTNKAIDNRAPLSEIIDKFSSKGIHSKSYKLYHQLVVPRKNFVKLNTLHSLIPCHNMKSFDERWDGQLPTDFFEQFQYKCSMPNIITEFRNIDKIDPLTELVKTKYDWDLGLKHSKRSIKRTVEQNSTDVHSLIKQLNDEVVQCPKYLIDYALQLESDPDPLFTSTYNWYYAGSGNMQLICINCIDYLLHSNFATVYMSAFNRESSTIENSYTASFDCGEDNNILETIFTSQNIVALRTKYKIFILKIIEKERNSFNIEELKQLESKIPYTSISFDKYHTNILYTTTLDSKLTLTNIDRLSCKTVKLKSKRNSLVNNWNSVIGVNRGIYMHLERNVISMYDKRVHEPIVSYSKLTDILDMVACNDISAAKHCEDSPSLYFATQHNAFLMDTRYFSKEPKLKVVQRWMHGLRCAPTYITIGKADRNREFVVLSSQWCEDTCIIENYADSAQNCNVQGTSMPYHAPDLLQVLNAARLKMLCCDLHKPVEPRVVAATSGQLLIDQGTNHTILTQTSFGDIYTRTLYPHYMESFMEDNSAQNLHNWSQSIKLKKNIFEVTSVRDISAAWKELKKIPNDYTFNVFEPPKFDKNNFLDAFANEELIPELLDLWLEDAPLPQRATADRLQFEDSDMEEE